MDLSYPPEVEAYRLEVRAWLEDNLPDGWFDPGFELTGPSESGSTRSGPASCSRAGGSARSWPKEYGGKGLSTLEAVAVTEEFARANAPMRADFFGDTLVGPTILQWGTEEQKRQFLPGHPARRDQLVPGVLRARRRIRPGVALDQGRSSTATSG